MAVNPAILESIIERIRDSATVDRVYGEPLTVGDKTVIPIAKIGYGMGGGFGSAATDDEGGVADSGGGGGIGVSVTPVGVLEVTELETRLVRFRERKRIVAALGIGLVLGLLLARRRS